MFGAMAELFDLHWVMISRQALTASVLHFCAFEPFPPTSSFPAILYLKYAGAGLAPLEIWL